MTTTPPIDLPPPELGPPQNRLLRYTAWWASQGKTSRRSIAAESADEAALLFVKQACGYTDEATVCVGLGYGPDAGLVCRYKVSLGVYRIVPMKKEPFVGHRRDLS